MITINDYDIILMIWF